MNAFVRIRHTLRSLFSRSAARREIDDELSFHLERAAADHVANGMPDGDARQAARRRFGNVQAIRENCRDATGTSFGEAVLQDVRFGVRMLRKNPGFTSIAVLTLALGIGANTSMWTVLQSITMRPLPYPKAELLVRVFCTSAHSRTWPHSVPNLLDYQVQNQSFEHLAAFSGGSWNLAEPGQPAERLRGIRVSANMFSTLGAQPQIGRAFTPEEERSGNDGVAILSHDFWLQHYAGDPKVLGRALRLDGENVTVVGVLPERFDNSRLSGEVKVWRPLAFTDDERGNRGWNWVNSVARLKEGVSLRQAQAEMKAISARLHKIRSDTDEGLGVRLVPLAEVGNETGRRMIWLTMGLAGFVLLIACVNLANLQFAKTAGRARELAIRGAIGASRRRLLRQLMTESLTIAALGGLVGVVVAMACNAVLNAQLPGGAEGGIRFGLSGSTFGFAFAVTAVAGLVFALIPAWMASRVDLNSALKQGARGMTGDRGQNRLRHALVVCEVALALVLLAGAGVVWRGIDRFSKSDVGWNPAVLTTASLALSDSRYASGESRAAFVENLRQKLATIPGVVGFAAAREMPLRGFDIATSFEAEGQPDFVGQKPLASINVVTPSYFETLGMRLMAGRDFSDADRSDSPPVIIINEAMAQRYWPGEMPIGRRMQESGVWREVVGIVNDIRFPAKLEEPQTRLQTYRPIAQNPSEKISIAVRGNISARVLREVVSQLDPDLPLNDVSTAQEIIDRSLTGAGMTVKLLAAFALLGLVLAALGIYGVISGFVAQREGEIGVRMALGARIDDVIWLVLGKGLRMTLIGTLVGTLGAFGLSRLLAAIAPELSGSDPLLFLAICAVLLLVALAACWIPARQAARVDPIIALRAE